MPGWIKHKLESRLLGETSESHIYIWYHPYGRKRRRTKEHHDESEKIEESEKVGLKLNIQKANIMASGPVTSWQINGETVETVTDFYVGGLQNHCRWWLQPWNKKAFIPWKKSYDQTRQHIKKQRHYSANKVHLFRAMVFPVVMYGCENWIIRKAEHWRIDVLSCGVREDS